ncbi:hypothetical protein AYI68_g1103 [Smittium mucronatum]|uniref:Uncharacterized protein n=1 Tax=Smittium mucronatum TaxID=133383 RepID=A0A1R0H6H9_9FUNG|nr:hypothetical protein AYI68_g1103 [Smittium mucronatum]
MGHVPVRNERGAVFADGSGGEAGVQALEEDAGLAQIVARHVAAVLAGGLDGHFDFTLDGEQFSAVDNVENGAGPDGFQVLEEHASMAAVRVRGVRALGSEIVQLLEVGVHDNLFLIRVFKRFGARDEIIAIGYDFGAPGKPGHVAAQHVHEDGLGDIVGIVAKRAVVLPANGFDDFVHAPAIQILVRQYNQLHAVLFLVPLHRLINNIAFTVSNKSGFHDMCEHSRVLTARGPNSDTIASLEQLVVNNSVVDLLFKHGKETRLADRLPGLWSFDYGSVLAAYFAQFRHLDQDYCNCLIKIFAKV